MDVQTADGTEGVSGEFAALAQDVYAGDPRWIPEEAAVLAAFFSASNPLLSRMRVRTWCVPGRSRLAAFVSDGLEVDGAGGVLRVLGERR